MRTVDLWWLLRRRSADERDPQGLTNVLAVIAFNLTRAAAVIAATGPTGCSDLAKATTATVRRKLIHVPARVASSARRITLHLPQAWPWQQPWTRLFDRIADPPAIASS